MELRDTSRYDNDMAYEIELVFRDRALDTILRGKFKVEQGQITVTSQDGRRKIKQLDGSDADAIARSMLHEMEADNLH